MFYDTTYILHTPALFDLEYWIVYIKTPAEGNFIKVKIEFCLTPLSKPFLYKQTFTVSLMRQICVVYI